MLTVLESTRNWIPITTINSRVISSHTRKFLSLCIGHYTDICIYWPSPTVPRSMDFQFGITNSIFFTNDESAKYQDSNIIWSALKQVGARPACGNGNQCQVSPTKVLTLGIFKSINNNWFYYVNK